MGGTESVPVETNEPVHQRRTNRPRSNGHRNNPSHRPNQRSNQRSNHKSSQRKRRHTTPPNPPTPAQNEELSAYEMLSLRPDCTIKELQKKYKQLAQIYHPDRGGSAKMFSMLNKAYEKIYHEKKNELKHKINEPVINKEYKAPVRKTENVYLDKDKFDNEKFNQVFRDYRIDNPYDKGYGNNMAESSKTREDISIERMNSLSTGNFNSRFVDTNCTEVIQYEEPQALYSNQKSFDNIMELGVKEINDFSGKNFTDYQKAYDNKFYNPNDYKRKEYRSMQEYENARASQSMAMTDKDKEYYRMKEEMERNRELQRQKQVSLEDRRYEHQFNELNKIMIRR